MVNQDYRVDIELVPANQKDLTAIQQKLNQWITTGTLIKFESSIVGNNVLFTICRKK